MVVSELFSLHSGLESLDDGCWLRHGYTYGRRSRLSTGVKSLGVVYG